MDTRARELVTIGDALFSQRLGLLSLWQTIADNFYPMRADFTVTRHIGAEFADHLVSSYPVMACRDLADLFAAMLRPRSSPWFAIHTQEERIDEDPTARKWLEWASGVQRRAVYDREAGFVNATKQGDHDFTAFGQAVLEVRENHNLDALLYRSWHLRDAAWSDNAAGRTDCMHLNWTPTARQLARLFPGNVHRSVSNSAAKEPERRINCRRIVVPRDDYDYRDNRLPRANFYSLYVDIENSKVMQEGPINRFGFVVPRWQTVSGSQYARSPVTEIMLPDARTLQAVMATLLEAGQRAADPPLVAVEEALRSDVQALPGGITFLDMAYDERLGEAIRPLVGDKSGLPFGEAILDRLQSSMANGFMANKVSLPPDLGKMTAYETRKRIEEHLRSSAPLFEPIEEEYNAPLMENTFEVLMSRGAFGPVESIPEILRNQDIRFSFVNPLREAEDDVKAQKLMEGLALVGQAAQFDPSQVANINMTKGVRESLQGIGWSADWLNPEEAVEEARAQQAQAQETAQVASQADAAAEIAGKLGPAADGIKKAFG